MNIFKIISKIITEPVDFFERVNKGENNLGFAFAYYAVLSLFGKIMRTIIGLLSLYFFVPFIAEIIPFYGKLVSGALEKLTIQKIITNALSSYIVYLFLIFVGVGIFYLIIKLFGGNNNYTKTFELVAYSSTPMFLFSWIPFVGWAANIWSFVLTIIGIEKIHKLSRIKAIIICVIPILLIFILSMVFFGILLKYLSIIKPLR